MTKKAVQFNNMATFKFVDFSDGTHSCTEIKPIQDDGHKKVKMLEMEDIARIHDAAMNFITVVARFDCDNKEGQEDDEIKVGEAAGGDQVSVEQDVVPVVVEDKDHGKRDYRSCTDVFEIVWLKSLRR